jgi:hypothetical protein
MVLAALPAVGLGPWSGCSEELGPERMETTRVIGEVQEGSYPVRGGWVEFAPVDGTVGLMRSAPIGPDGRFAADRVAVGVNRVGVVGAPLRVAGRRRLFETLRTPIRRTIPGGPSTTVAIDLLDEEVQFQAAAKAASERN